MRIYYDAGKISSHRFPINISSKFTSSPWLHGQQVYSFAFILADKSDTGERCWGALNSLCSASDRNKHIEIFCEEMLSNRFLNPPVSASNCNKHYNNSVDIFCEEVLNNWFLNLPFSASNGSKHYNNLCPYFMRRC